jgi:hypothetical protein
MEVKITNTAILSCIAEDYWKPVIETDLTAEEHAMIADEVAEKKRDPSSVKSWREVRRGKSTP